MLFFLTFYLLEVLIFLQHVLLEMLMKFNIAVEICYFGYYCKLQR